MSGVRRPQVALRPVAPRGRGTAVRRSRQSSETMLVVILMFAATGIALWDLALLALAAS
jgi:hypothetical protein